MGRIFFFFQAEDGIRDVAVTGVQTCALPICPKELQPERSETKFSEGSFPDSSVFSGLDSSLPILGTGRSEEHTSELQSRLHLVCRLLLEKKKRNHPSHLQHVIIRSDRDLHNTRAAS